MYYCIMCGVKWCVCVYGLLSWRFCFFYGFIFTSMTLQIAPSTEILKNCLTVSCYFGNSLSCITKMLVCVFWRGPEGATCNYQYQEWFFILVCFVYAYFGFEHCGKIPSSINVRCKKIKNTKKKECLRRERA